MRFTAVRERIDKACRAAGRDADEVRLLAVSKTRPAAAISAAGALGQTAFGENYVDEALAKIRALAGDDLEWHFIGPVQSNKTRDLAAHFDWVQSVDRVKIARRLADQRPDDRGALNVTIQVNVDAEPQKAGCSIADAAALAEDIAGRDRLALRGLMAIPAAVDEPDEARPAFARLRELFERLRSNHPDMDTLSMGMSSDLEAAIAEGATMVRVGTDLFGPRDG